MNLIAVTSIITDHTTARRPNPPWRTEPIGNPRFVTGGTPSSLRITAGRGRPAGTIRLFVFLSFLSFAPALHSQELFYNYYDNGLKFIEKGDWQRAIEEFKSAVSLEYEDAARKRTYGTRFIKYFPHCELGVAYYNLGEYESARTELELSLAYTKSKRSEEYLGKLNSAGGLAVVPPGEPTPQAKEQPPDKTSPTPPPPQPKMEPAPVPATAGEPRGAEAERTELTLVAPPPPLPSGAMTYDPSRVTQVGSRLSLAVMPLEGKGAAAEISDMLTEKLITELVNLRRFRVIERAALDKLLREQALGVSGVVDEATAVEVGKVAGADAIVLGSVTLAEKFGKISARVISVETSETVVAEEADTKSTRITDMEKITSQVAIGLYNAMPLVEGTIIAVEEGELYIDIGANVGLKKGTKCIAFSEGEPIKHPVTGEVMGKRNKKLAELVLVQVQDRMAIAKYIQNEKGTAGIGDKVVVK